MAEKKYIDADEMIANENEAYKNSLVATNGTEKAMTNLFVHLKINKLLQDTPAADVVEVRHGEWVYERYGGMYPCGCPRPEYKCPVCGDWTMQHERKYCPECGAKMDGKEGN